MDLVFIAVDKVSVAWLVVGGVAGTDDEGGGHADDGCGDGDEDDLGGADCEPFLQGTACLRAAGEAFFLLALAVGDDAVGDDDPDGDDKCPHDGGDSNPAFLDAETWDGENHDHVEEEKNSCDEASNLCCLRRSTEKEEEDDEVHRGESGVCEVEETTAAGVQARWRDEHRDEEKDPPHECDSLYMLVLVIAKAAEHTYQECDCEVSHEANAPEVVWRDGWIIWAQITTAVRWCLMWEESGVFIWLNDDAAS